MKYYRNKKKKIKEKKRKKEKKKIKEKNKICILGLIPFLYIAFYFNSLTGLTIFINGFLFHSNFLNYNIMFYIDFFFNTFFMIYYIIISKYDFYIILLLSISSCIFIYTNFINNYFRKNIILNNIIHVIFVQGVSCIALTRYYLVI